MDCFWIAACRWSGPAQRSAYDEPCPKPSPLLSDHADLLRECAAAPGPRLLDHCLRRHCAAQAGAGHRHLVPNRHGRARAEDRAVGGAGRKDARRIRRRHLGRVPRPVGSARAYVRRLHPHHRRAAQARRSTPLRRFARPRLHLQGLVHGPVLRERRGLCRRASRHALPRLRAHDGDGERGKLFLQALGLRAQAAGVLRGQPGVHGA